MKTIVEGLRLIVEGRDEADLCFALDDAAKNLQQGEGTPARGFWRIEPVHRAEAVVSREAEGAGHEVDLTYHGVAWQSSCSCGWRNDRRRIDKDNAFADWQAHVAAATGAASGEALVIDAAAEVDGNTAVGWLLCELIADERFDDVISDRNAVKVEVHINDRLIPFADFAEAVVKRIERAETASGEATKPDLRERLAEWERSANPDDNGNQSLRALLYALVERAGGSD